MHNTVFSNTVFSNTVFSNTVFRVISSGAINFNYGLIVITLFGPTLYITISLLVLSAVVGSLAAVKWEREYVLYLLSLHLIVLSGFATDSIVWFYIIFELLMLPIFLTINVHGQSEDKVDTSYKFLYFALLTSLLWLVSIVNLFDDGIDRYINSGLLAVGMLVPLLAKVPMPPFHLWLNDAHTGCPVSGSIILAGSVLKLSIYGLMIFYISTFDGIDGIDLPIDLDEVVIVISCFSVVGASVACIRHIDYKRLIAYTSVCHMNMILYVVMFNNDSDQGSIIMLIGHGLISISLFYHVNSLYERFHTKVLLYIRGITFVMPIMSIFGLFYNLANFSFPPTVNWFAEYLMLSPVIFEDPFNTSIVGLSIFVGILYSLWAYFRAYFGSISKYLASSSDMNYTEFLLLVTIMIYVTFSTIFMVQF